jgi:hypothetical protein
MHNLLDRYVLAHPVTVMLKPAFIRCGLLTLTLLSTHASELYGGAWALRIESDVKASFSWIGNYYPNPDLNYHSLFIEPMVGISGSGLFGGYEMAFTSDIRSKKWSRYRFKLGAIRSYNNPWIIDNNETYGYVGIECGFVNFIYGLNGHVGALINGSYVYPSFGYGYGF